MALIKRVAAVLGSDKPMPGSWSELSLTEQLVLEQADPTAASVLQGRHSAEVELELLSGKFAEVAPAVKSDAQLREEAIEAAFAALPPIPTEAERAAQVRAQAAELEAGRVNSYVQAYGRWGQ